MWNDEPLPKVPPRSKVPDQWDLRLLPACEKTKHVSTSTVKCAFFFVVRKREDSCCHKMWKRMGHMSAGPQGPQMQTTQEPCRGVPLCMRSDQEHGHGHPLRSVALQNRLADCSADFIIITVRYDNDYDTSVVISAGDLVNRILTRIYYHVGCYHSPDIHFVTGWAHSQSLQMAQRLSLDDRRRLNLVNAFT